MPFLELFDETLDINSTENYELSLEVSLDSFSFSLLDTLRNKFVLIRSLQADDNKYFNAGKIKELLEQDDFLVRRYKKVNIVMPSQKFTLVPAPFFDPGKKDEYFTFNFGNEDDNPILVNKTENPDTYLVFSVSKNIYNVISEFFPGVHPYHQLKPLLSHVSHAARSVTGNYIHLHIEREFFNLIVFNSSQLKFCNSFKYRNVSDILYFVLNVFKKQGLKQDETIQLSGLSEKYDELYSNFSIYVKNIKFAEPYGNFTFSYVFNETALHRFLNLFSIVNCE